MNDFDHAAGLATQADPEAVVQRLQALAGTSFRFRDWFTTRPIPLPGGPARTADLVAVLDGPAGQAETLLVFELQAQHDEDKLETTLVEAAVFRAYSRHGEDRKGKYRVLCGLVYLRGACPTAVLDMTVSGGFGTRHAPLLWEVAKDSAEAALEHVSAGRASWGLLFWIALMTGAEQPGNIARWKDPIHEKVQDRWTRGLLVEIALTFAELSGRFLDWEHGLGGIDMMESQYLNRYRRQGEVRRARAYLLEVLLTKFPQLVSEDVVQLVERQDDLALLNTWFTSAVQAIKFEEFLNTLKG